MLVVFGKVGWVSFSWAVSGKLCVVGHWVVEVADDGCVARDFRSAQISAENYQQK